MKCCLKSIRSFASLGLALLLSGATLQGGAGTDAVATDPIAGAIYRAVEARVGARVSITISDVSGLRLAAEPRSLVAVPAPTARVGMPARFLLTDQPAGRRSRARIGEVTATVQITADAVRARRPIGRGGRLAPADLVLQATDLVGRPLRALPGLEEIVGSRALRDLDAGSVITRADVVAEAIVRSGDMVRALARVGDVEVQGELVAAESGVRDDVIRVVNQETRQVLRARVTGAGEVEVVNVP